MRYCQFCLCLSATFFLTFYLIGCRPRPSAPVSSPSASGQPQAQSSSQPQALFRDVAQVVGLNFRWGHATREHINILETIGHGCAFLDYDGDGRMDILLVGSAQCRLYRNMGSGKFTDVTAQSLPLPPDKAHFLGCSVADYDNDGHPDILLTGYGSVALYHNRGNGTFEDVTKGSGLAARNASDWTTSAAWADVDGDERLDVYICRYVQFTPQSRQLCGFKALDGANVDMACSPVDYPAQKGSLYRNEGNGHFRDITRQAGLSNTHGNGLGVQFCDFNGDGMPDLYIANDTQICDLYQNMGQGRFQEVGAQTGVAYGASGLVQAGMGVDWGDYDNDGRFDLLVANYANQPKSLYHNEGSVFVNNTYASGLAVPTLRSLSFGAAFVDYDNDGLLDIVFTNGHVQSEVEKVDRTTTYLQPSQLFHNADKGHFTDAGAEAGPDFARPIAGRGMAVGDYDGDGRPDLLVVNDEGSPLLLHNEERSGNHWLTLHCLQGPGKWDSIGAQVTVIIGKRKQIAEVRAGGSYLSASSPEVHFGLGKAMMANSIQIRWPDGRKSLFHAAAADHIYQAMSSSNTLILLK